MDKKFLDTSNYKRICNKLYKILMEENNSKITYSIPWLHLLKNHNEISSQYCHLFEEKKLGKNFFFFLYFKKIIKFYKIIFSRTNKKIINKNLNIDYIFISHLVNHDQLSYTYDYYFKNLPNLLSNDKKVLVLFINHTKTSNNEILFKKINDNYFRIVLSNSLGLFYELKNIFKLLKENKKFKIKRINSVSNLDYKIFNYLSKFNNISQSLSSLRVADQLEHYLKIYKIKAVFTPYEAHAWERLVFLKVNLQKNIKSFAFLTSPIYLQSNSIKISLKTNYNPDYILTKFNIDKSILLNNSNLSSEILSLQSNFFDSNLSKLIVKKNNLLKKKITCLVTPEGLDSESDMLFEFSKIISKKMPNIFFIFRSHPLLKKNIKISNTNMKFLAQSKNFIISKKNLESDIKQSDWILYRGSSSVFNAVAQGLLPIYINLHQNINIDPLYSFANKYLYVNDYKDFINLFNIIKKKNELIDQLRIKLIESYKHEIDKEKFLNLIKHA